MKRSLNLAVLGIDHGHIFDMLDEMIKEGCKCNHFWTEGYPLTLKEFNKKYPNIKRSENKNYNEIIKRPKTLMDKNNLKKKKQENDNLQEIFYKGSSKKGTY